MTPWHPQKTVETRVVVEVEKEPWWSKAWAFTRKYLLAPLPLLLLIVGAAVLITLGAKNVQIGGLIGKLLGRKNSGTKAIDVANSIPKDRVDSNGAPIPIGSPDSKGITQAKVVPLEKPGLFEDPKKVHIKDPETGKATAVDVPDGIKAKDIDTVVIVTPKITEVTVKSDSKVSAKNVDDLLKKYPH
jgi:hypothetical protein